MDFLELVVDIILVELFFVYYGFIDVVLMFYFGKLRF